MEHIKPDIGQQPIIFALQGELGTGKTQFVKGLAHFLGYSGLVTSPSYTLVNEYQLPANNLLVHIDAWRLPHPTSDIMTVGWNNFLKQKAVIALEWPPTGEFAKLAPQAWWITGEFLYVNQDVNQRKIYLQEQP